MLFVPGLTDLADEYLELLDAFLPRRALVVEVRGRGRSEAPATGYSATDHADDLEAVLQEAGLERFHLMTFSRGTTWSLHLAARDPSRIASMSIGDYAAQEVGLPDGFVDAQMQTRFRGRPMEERVSEHVLCELAAASEDHELWDVLALLDCPLLVARPSDGGGVVTDAVVERYRRARSDVEVVTVPGPTHDIFRVDRTFYPRAVAELIDRRLPGE